jgi:hypothetical protein
MVTYTVLKEFTADVYGTSMQGTINITYNELVRLFGEPPFDGDGEKVTCEWILDIDGHIVTIYDWKIYQYDINVTELTNWHIGGNDGKSVDLLKQVLEDNKATMTLNKDCFGFGNLLALLDDEHRTLLEEALRWHESRGD